MTTETRSGIHPLMAGAAVAVIIACGVAIAAVTGYLPGSNAQKAEAQAAPANSPAAAQRPLKMASAPASASSQAASQPASPPKARCVDCGVVTDVKTVEIKGQSSGIGAVAGGVVGAVVGHEVIDGKNQGLATVAGGVAGAVAGNEIEKYSKNKKQYNVAVRMDDGSTKTIAYAEAPAWKPGDKVKVAGTTLQPQK